MPGHQPLDLTEDVVAEGIQRLARGLQDKYRKLCHLKMTSRSYEQLGSSGGKPGSKVPVPTPWASDLDLDLTNDLHHMLIDVAEHVPAGRCIARDLDDMLGWITFHAWDIACTPLAQRMRETLMDMDRRMAAVAEGDLGLIKGSDVVAQLARAGHPCSMDTLRQWVRRGHIHAVRRGRTNLYDMDQVMRYVGI